MSIPQELVLGEFSRTLDERFRLTLPPELLDPLFGEGTDAILAKERPGCLSVWNSAVWQAKLDAGLDLVQSKMRAGKLEGRWEEVQRFGRLISARQRPVKLAGRGRLLLPEGFRQFLQVEPNGDLFVVGAGVCIEIWNPAAWLSYVETNMPEFRQLFDQLSG